MLQPTARRWPRPAQLPLDLQLTWQHSSGPACGGVTQLTQPHCLPCQQLASHLAQELSPASAMWQAVGSYEAQGAACHLVCTQQPHLSSLELNLPAVVASCSCSSCSASAFALDASAMLVFCASATATPQLYNTALLNCTLYGDQGSKAAGCTLTPAFCAPSTFARSCVSLACRAACALLTSWSIACFLCQGKR